MNKNRLHSAIKLMLCLGMGCIVPSLALAQRSKPTLAPTSSAERMAVQQQREQAEINSWTSGLSLRCVGPTIMSGRVVDVAVVAPDGRDFFVAYATGGLWRTQNHGTTFEPLFDNALSITLGAIAFDPVSQRLWAGTGEVNSSRSSYAGTGMYLSDDMGKSWKHVGLEDTHHIGRIALHPTDSNVAYVAALGPLYSSNNSGGVYRTVNGGEDWEKVLEVPGAEGVAGAVDLILDESNPDHLFAATWDRTRRAWNFVGNGAGSRVWESQDGGTTWSSLDEGFPSSIHTGRIGLAWHPHDGVLFALVDNQSPAAEGNENKEEDAGYEPAIFEGMTATTFAALDTAKLAEFLENNNFPNDATAESVFQQIESGTLLPRALYDFLTDGNKDLFEAEIVGAEVYRIDLRGSRVWEKTHDSPLEDVCYTYGYYFGLIEVDPADSKHLWIAGVPLLESNDGGNQWKSIGAPNVHVDHHHLWVNASNSSHLINGNDGGINISWDGGKNWIKCNSPAVGQFYAVEVDQAEPYRIYGGLQDNGTWMGPSTYQSSPGWHQEGRYPWESIGGGDGMQIEVDPRDPSIVISGSQFGWYSRSDRTRKDWFGIHPPHQLGEKPFRWNWQTPIWLSRHQSDILFMASNRLHRSFDQGRNWETISPDLTRGGVPGNVPFGTITCIHESPLRFGQLAVGTDDGLIQVSRDGGYTWSALASPVPQYPLKNQTLWISEVLWSAHHPQRLFVTLNGYRLDHFQSYVFMTENDGRTWVRLGGSDSDGPLPDEPVNALVESAKHSNFLVTGTDGGAYASMDLGKSWGLLHPDLPHVPVHDLVIQEREQELIIGTHGRSIWVLDLEPLMSHWDSNASWAATASEDWGGDNELEVTWQEDWGKRGWAWREPKALTVEADAFVPLNDAGVWHLVSDSLGVDWTVTEELTLPRGWQRLEIPIENAVNDSIEYPSPGRHELKWISRSGINPYVIQVDIKPEEKSAEN